MEGPSLPWLLLATLASCIIITYKLLIHGKKNPTTKTTPSRLLPGPAGIPLLGNIFDLKGELHHALARLAGLHGPVMSLKLGATTAIVVSSTACARDVLQTHDRLLAARSISDAARALDNHERSVIWLPSSSPLWKRLRALCARHLFSAHGLEATRAAREEKARELVGCLRARAEARAGQAVDVGRVVLAGMLNVMSNALFSEDVVAGLLQEQEQEMEMLIKDVLEELARPNLSDLFPALAVLDLQGRRRRTAERLRKFFDFFDPIIGRRMAGGGERKDDFLDVLLRLHSEGQMSILTVKSFLADLFVAGTDTNYLTVEWTMAELLRQPAVMSKARAELQEALGSKQHPEESDMVRLPFLRAVIMESMRLHPPSPLLMPHHATAEGAQVAGFAVPKGTTVVVNLWAVMRDPATWAQPEEFLPERFVGLHSDMDFRGKDKLEFMPFGAGRRACPGIPMATRVVTLVLASLLHAFEWRLPEGMLPCDVDLTDRYGTSLNMATPLKAVPVPLG